MSHYVIILALGDVGCFYTMGMNGRLGGHLSALGDLTQLLRPPSHGGWDETQRVGVSFPQTAVFVSGCRDPVSHSPLFKENGQILKHDDPASFVFTILITFLHF